MEPSVTFSMLLMETSLLPSSTSSPPGPNASKTTGRGPLLLGLHFFRSFDSIVVRIACEGSSFFLSAAEVLREEVMLSSHFARFCSGSRSNHVRDSRNVCFSLEPRWFTRLLVESYALSCSLLPLSPLLNSPGIHLMPDSDIPLLAYQCV